MSEPITAFIYIPNPTLYNPLVTYLAPFCQTMRLMEYRQVLAACQSDAYQLGFISAELDGYSLADLTASLNQQLALMLILPQQDHLAGLHALSLGISQYFCIDDITTDLLQKAANFALEIKRQHYELLLDYQRLHHMVTSLPHGGICTLDREFRFQFINSPILEDIAKTSSVLGQSPFDVLPEDTAQALEELFYQAMAGEVVQGEVSLMDKTYWVTASPIYDDERSIYLVAMAGQEITALKGAYHNLTHQAALLDQLPEAIVTVDTDYFITSWNKGAEQLYGWRADEAIGQHLNQVFPPEQSIKLREEHLQILESQGHWEGEVIQQDKQGRPLQIHTSSKVIYDNQGLMVGAVGVSFDVNDRKYTRHQYAFHSRLLTNLHDAVIATDLSYTIVSWNPAAERIYGWTAEEAIGRSVDSLLDTTYLDPQHSDKAASQTLQTQGHWQGEVIQNHKNGDRIFVLSSITIIKDDMGQPTIVVAVNHDLTNLKQAQQRLAFQASLVEHVRDSIVAADENLQVIYWNRGAEQLYGWTQEEAIGQHVRDLLQLQFAIPASEADEEMEKHGIWRGQVQALRRDGRLIPTFLSLAPLRNEKGEMIGRVGISYDISDTKEMERQQAEFEAEKQRASLLRRFVGHATHDLMTPITSLKTSLYLLERINQEERSLRYVHRMTQQVDKMHQLLSSFLTMLDVEEMESSQLYRAPNLLKRIVQEVIIEQAEPTRFKLLLDDNLLAIRFDENLIKRAVQEVVRNAIQFSPPEATIHLRTYLQEAYQVVEIKDLGIGMSPHEMAHIFERFYRADSARNTDAGGTGLGLALVKRIMEIHDGKATAESRLNQGSIFRLWLPI